MCCVVTNREAIWLIASFFLIADFIEFVDFADLLFLYLIFPTRSNLTAFPFNIRNFQIGADFLLEFIDMGDEADDSVFFLQGF